MNINEIKKLELPEICVVNFKRFTDQRGYFTETYRKSDVVKDPVLTTLLNFPVLQSNESYSKTNVVRGLHFQWNPYMGKLVRTIRGHMIDLVLDIRKESPTVGKIIAYDMPSHENNEYGEWIYVPPGFAHGNLFLEDTIIEYYCSGEYNGSCEAGISPLDKDIDWSLCDKKLFEVIGKVLSNTAIMSDKDKNGLGLKEWLVDPRSDNFIFGKLVTA